MLERDGEPVDAMADLLWSIEQDPTLRSTILAIAVLDGPPDRAALVARFDRLTRAVPRLGQRIVSSGNGLGPARWAEADVDLEYHVRRVVCPAPGDRRALLDLCGPVFAGDFDRQRPLWEATIVEGLEDGRAAVVLKLHHSLSDGLGAVEIAAELFDFEPDAPMRPDVAPPAPPRGPSLEQQVRRTLELQAATGRWLLGAARRPDRALPEAVDVVRSALRMIAPVGAPRSPLLRGRTMRRHLDSLEVPLDDLRAAAHVVGATINDAFLAAVIGGVAAYHRAQGSELDDLRLTVPISVRDGGDGAGGNRWTPARPVVPADIEDPAERMRAVHEVLIGWRNEPGIDAADAIADMIRQLPEPAVVGLVGGMMHGVDLVVTDVPGLPVPVWLVGTRVRELIPIAPPGGAAANVALLSYAGVAHVGLALDTGAVADPQAFVGCLRDSFDEVIAVGR